MLSSAVQEMKRHLSPFLVLIYACANWWFTANSAETFGFESINPFSGAFFSLAMALPFVALYIASRSLPDPMLNAKNQKLIMLYSAAAGSLSAVLDYFAPQLTILPYCTVACFGTFNVALVFSYISRLMPLGIKSALYHFMAGAALSCLFAPLSYIPGNEISNLFLLIGPPQTIVLLMVTFDSKSKSLPTHDPFLREGISHPSAPFFLLVSVYVLAGVFSGFKAETSPSGPEALPFLFILDTLIGIAIIAIHAKSGKVDLQFLVHKTGMPLLVAGIAVLAISIIHENPAVGFVSMTISAIGPALASSLVWITCILFAAKDKRLDPRMYAVLFAFKYASVSLGSFLGCFATSSPSSTEWTAITLVTLLVVAYGISFAERLLAERYYKKLPAFNLQGGTSDSMEAAFDYIREECGFTPREFEVFQFVAQGHSRGYIASKLTISENTVKGHISKVYQKMQIHSREELLERIDGAKAYLRSNR